MFLDEVGELPLATQAKLLRVIERREVTRLGALKPQTIDVRFIAATNRDLEQLVARGEFRHDLYFRLNGASLIVPPLRERVEEIPGLTALFIRQFCKEAGRPPLRISRPATALLQRYAWPGNVRELRNVIERAVLLCTGPAILPEHFPLERMGRTLPPRSTQSSPPAPSSGIPPRRMASSRSRTLVPPARTQAPEHQGFPDAEPERQRIIEALQRCGGNQSHAAQALGISRGTLISRIDKYQITRPRKRDQP